LILARFAYLTVVSSPRRAMPGSFGDVRWPITSRAVPHWRRRDLQPPAEGSSGSRAQVKLTLPGRQPLPGHGLERRHLLGVIRRAQVLDAAEPHREDHTICSA
jgi:hypothetical protein